MIHLHIFYNGPEPYCLFMENLIEYLHTAPLSSPGILSIIIFTGFLVGFVNTVAGMATAISYALFMAMGMPINVANGTTRFGVLSQFVVNSFIFKKKGYLNLQTGTKVGIPVAIGALLGAELAAVLRPHIIEVIMGILLPVMAVLLFIDTKKITGSRKKTSGTAADTGGQAENTKPFTGWKAAAFVLIGIYGGFTHAGVGLLIMFGSFFMLGLDMLRSNAIKQFAVVIYTPIALAVFIWYGQINWPVAMIYAVGNIAGGVAGSYASIKGGAKFIKICVAAAIFAMSFWLIYKQFSS